MNLIILTQTDAIGNDRYTLTDHRAAHIRTVLKRVLGETVEIGILNSLQGKAVITQVNDSSVMLECREWYSTQQPLAPTEILCAIPRPKTLKKVFVTCAMMGVNRLHLVRAFKTDKSYFCSPLLQPENALPYFIEGLSLGKLTHQPEIIIHPLFRPAIEDYFAISEATSDIATNRFLADSSSGLHLDKVYKANPTESALIAIGPEGGWVEFESTLLQEAGFRKFSIGPWTLRVETALTSALAQLQLVRQLFEK
ncbi:MAG: RsmE family RNA methyltransferase [candidate division Zixibacteria bacterium]|nr:RsmE family RNA methyltransferase [candidate division Zixibacteria bacterium]